MTNFILRWVLFSIAASALSDASSCYFGHTSESVKTGANDVMVSQVNGYLKSTQLSARLGKTSGSFRTWFSSRDGKTGTVSVNGRSIGVVLNDKGQVLVHRRNGRKSCTFNNGELRHFQLREGANRATIRFTDYPSVQIRFVFWLVRQDEKMFVTDIDGTITKSDMSGFLLPKLGVDHHHSGVVKFLRGIARNGYRVIYLTARPLGLDEDTRDYLKDLDEDGVRLPDGPLFSSPVSVPDMVTSSRGHNVDKKLTLTAIVNLFNVSNTNEVIAGAIGNADTDRMAYEAAGVDNNRIYMVDKTSSVVNVGSNMRTSYDNLLSILDTIFPKRNLFETSEEELVSEDRKSISSLVASRVLNFNQNSKRTARQTSGTQSNFNSGTTSQNGYFSHFLLILCLFHSL